MSIRTVASAATSCVVGVLFSTICALTIWQASLSNYPTFHSAEETMMLVAIAIWMSIMGWCAALFGFELGC